MLTDMDGSLYVTPDRAELKADALVDGARMTLDVLQPVGGSAVTAERELSGTLSPEARETMAPGTGELISGPVGFVLKAEPDGRQVVTLDLKPAKTHRSGDRLDQGQRHCCKPEIRHADRGRHDKTLRSETVRRTGSRQAAPVTLKKGQLSAATFDRVALSPRDDYRVDITASGGSYKIRLGGNANRRAPWIASAKSVETAGPADNGKAMMIALSGPSTRCTAIPMNGFRRPPSATRGRAVASTFSISRRSAPAGRRW